MGWTSYRATFYKYVNGKRVIDRKAEMDSVFKEEENEVYHWKTLRSSMVGSTYYAAIERTEIANPENRIVYAVICLTSTDQKQYFDFAYKDMDETCGPYKYDCPKAILNLLTPTDNEYAVAWRQACLDKHYAKKNNPNDISNLRVGSKIKMVANGREYILRKEFSTIHIQNGKVKRLDTKWTDGLVKATTRCIKSWGYEVLHVATKTEENLLRANRMMEAQRRGFYA